jgi:hypothetical protein
MPHRSGWRSIPKPVETPSTDKIHRDAELLERLLLPYLLEKGRGVRYLRLRNIEIQRDKRGGALIQFADIVDAIWDAAIGFQQTRPIDPLTNREVEKDQ